MDLLTACSSALWLGFSRRQLLWLWLSGSSLLTRTGPEPREWCHHTRMWLVLWDWDILMEFSWLPVGQSMLFWYVWCPQISLSQTVYSERGVLWWPTYYRSRTKKLAQIQWIEVGLPVALFISSISTMEKQLIGLIYVCNDNFGVGIDPTSEQPRYGGCTMEAFMLHSPINHWLFPPEISFVPLYILLLSVSYDTSFHKLVLLGILYQITYGKSHWCNLPWQNKQIRIGKICM